MNSIPSAEDISSTCSTLAEKLCADSTSRTDVKLALVDVLDEALQGNLLVFILTLLLLSYFNFNWLTKKKEN